MTWIKGNWSHSGRAHARTNGEFTVRCAGVWRTRPLGIATDDGRGPRIAELCGYAVIGRIVLDIGTNRLTSITKTDQGGGHEIAFVPGGASYPRRERLDEILTPSAAPVWATVISASAGANSLVTHMEGARKPLQTKAPICCESIMARMK